MVDTGHWQGVSYEGNAELGGVMGIVPYGPMVSGSNHRRTDPGSCFDRHQPTPCRADVGSPGASR
jgi:hypothetical protein